MDYQVGNFVRTKKQHPCGSKLWEIIRVGVDFKLKCQGCRTCDNVTTSKGIENHYKKDRTGEGIVPFPVHFEINCS